MFLGMPPTTGFIMIRFAFLAAVFILFGFSPANAGDPRTLDWNMLLPELPELQSPFHEMPEELQFDVEMLADIRRLEAKGRETDDGYPLDEMRIDLTRRLTKHGIDIEAAVQDYEDLVTEIVRRNNIVAAELSGAMVRIPGYALPLEYEGESIKEFLLVPYVGACIHTPPPPPNQMVFVKVKQDFVADGLYEPVWVTGRLETQKVSKELSYVDGQAAIKVGYIMDGTNIKPYEREK